MPALRLALIVVMGMALASCSVWAEWPSPEYCAVPPSQGVTSNAPQDTTRGANGTSSTSNGTGSTTVPTAPACRPSHAAKN